MTEQKSNLAQGFGIASLVLGILTIPLGIIPCTFWIALFFGITGIILSAIALSKANQQNSSKGIIIAGLVCSIKNHAISTRSLDYGYWVSTRCTI